MKTKANIVNRYMAGIVDFGIASAILLIFTNTFEFNIILASIFILLRDNVKEGKSIGKIIFNLNIKKLQNEAPSSYRESILRNFMFIIPIVNIFMIFVELFLIFQDAEGIRMGDKTAMTKVVDDDTKLNNEIKDTFNPIPNKPPD